MTEVVSRDDKGNILIVDLTAAVESLNEFESIKGLLMKRRISIMKPERLVEIKKLTARWKEIASDVEAAPTGSMLRAIEDLLAENDRLKEFESLKGLLTRRETAAKSVASSIGHLPTELLVYTILSHISLEEAERIALKLAT